MDMTKIDQKKGICCNIAANDYLIPSFYKYKKDFIWQLELLTLFTYKEDVGVSQGILKSIGHVLFK